jgi:hypothetical protein
MCTRVDGDRRPASGRENPTRLDRLPNDLPKLKKWLEGVARDGERRMCYDVNGAGYILRVVAVRIPNEADERARDVVRCRETFQREILGLLEALRSVQHHRSPRRVRSR